VKQKTEITKNELDFILGQGEGQFTEFKERPDKSISKEMVAFANSTGGRIFIGISDDNKIKGVNQSNKLTSQIIDTALNCDPKIYVNLQQIDDILVVSVPESKNKPYSCSSGFYLRVGANSQKLTRDEIFKFAISQGIKAFDEEINSKFNYPDDFDILKFNDYLKAAKIESDLSEESLLINLGVAEYQDEKLVLNNAGILFFAKNPSKFFFSSKVVCGEFAYDDKAKILDKKVYDDGLLENIKQAINFITKRIKVEFVIESAEREEIPQYPEEAYREAVVNAIMHRDYVDKSSDIFIEVYRNKIIITNPGGLVNWLKKEDFGKLSKTRNTLIASLLARTTYVEKMGTGISRMNNAMKKAGLPELVFDYDEFTFFTNIYENEKIASTNKITEETVGGIDHKNEKEGEKEGEEYGEKEGEEYGEKEGEKEGEKHVVKYGKKYDVKYGENDEKVLSQISRNNKISISSIVAYTGLSASGVEKIILRLKDGGVIKRIGPAKGGHWEMIGNVIVMEYGERYGEKYGEKYGKNEEKVLSQMSQNNKISISNIAALTGLSTSGVEKIILRLKNSRVIERIGPAKGGHWEIIKNKNIE